MKILYTLFISILTFQGISQITLDSSDFTSPSDTFTIAIGKNTQNIIVNGGANATWDFSMFITDSLSGAKTRSIDKSKYPIDSLFPDAGMKVTSLSYGESYFIKNKDSLALDGISNLVVVPGNSGFTFNFNPNIKVIPFPMTHLDSFNSIAIIDTVVDTAITALSFDKIRVHAEFYASSVVEGYGTLITPQDTLDVLKLYTVEAQSFEIYGHHKIAGWLSSPFITQYDTAHKYRWFAKGKGYQVAEAITDEKNGTTTEASFLLSGDVFGFISKNNNPSCNGLNDGSATVTATGGSGNYTYKWSHSGTANSSTANNLPKGTYTATVTDIVSKKTSMSTTVLTEPDTMSTFLISKKDEGPLPNTGEIEIGVIGGTPGYSYAWNNSASTSKKASDLAGGKHIISVTDKNGCKKDTTIFIGSTVGINELSISELRLFPNPVTDYLRIDGLQKTISVFIMDITGKVILTNTVDHQNNTIDLSNVETGVYLVHLYENESKKSFRIIKE